MKRAMMGELLFFSVGCMRRERRQWNVEIWSGINSIFISWASSTSILFVSSSCAFGTQRFLNSFCHIAPRYQFSQSHFILLLQGWPNLIIKYEFSLPVFIYFQ